MPDPCIPAGLLQCLSKDDAKAAYNPAADIIAQNLGYTFGTILALAGIVAGYVFHLKGKQPKTVDYDVFVDSSILASAGQRVRNNLTIAWKDLVIEEPKIVEVMIQNTGKQAVGREEFDQPITIHVENGKILEASISEATNHAVRSEDLAMPTGSSSVVLNPLFLNAGESVVVQMIVDGFKSATHVTSRFKGQDRKMMEAPLRVPLRDMGFFPGFALFLGTMVAISVFSFAPGKGETVWGIIGNRVLTGVVSGVLAAVMSFMALSLFYSPFSGRRGRKRRRREV